MAFSCFEMLGEGSLPYLAVILRRGTVKPGPERRSGATNRSVNRVVQYVACARLFHERIGPLDSRYGAVQG